MSDGAVNLEQTLRERFGLEAFRPGQREVIEQVLGRRDVLCVMPTGGGKSLCYQLPALMLDGLTLVVSPLIALMKDQVDSLVQRGIRATLINSTLDPAEQRARMAEIEARQYDLVYVAPERFRSHRFVETMTRLRPALLAVDEAHCISEWGHDFRPDYARLGAARRALGSPPCIALTATATDLVRRDIADQLDLHEPAQFVTGFDRPNLAYRVIPARRDADKLKALAETLERFGTPAIVYASSRSRCELIARHLEAELGVAAAVYHAGLTREERTSAQERFMAGTVAAVVATNAFGMGVDKADIRAVIHFNLPGTLEAYYQEAGRAGRDGQSAHCLLLYNHADRFLQETFIENEYPPPDTVFRIYEFLRAQDADPIELTQAEIRSALGLEQGESAVGASLKILEGAGALERFRPRENMAIVRINADPEEGSLVDRVSAQAHVQRTVLLGVEGLVNRRYGEPIYFHPDQFAAALGLDRNALIRALRNLTAELPIDYIPPFRGNAIRILDRDRPARGLTIDFTSLSQRKQQEYDKLERMIQYAVTRQCRRAFILGYFGDAGAAGCGHCDRCEEQGGIVPPSSLAGTIDTTAGREVLQKTLSGVARAKGRFGKTVVAQMLVGSTTEKMVRWGLTRLSTFGILKASGFNRKEVSEIIDALTLAGLIESEDVDRFKPVIRLSARGWEWLKNPEGEPLSLALPLPLLFKVRSGGLERIRVDTAPPPRPSLAPPRFDRTAIEEPTRGPRAALPPSDPDAELRQRLHELRDAWARQSGTDPNALLPDAYLETLVRERPQSPRDLAAIGGISASKLERFGTGLLQLVRQFPSSTGSFQGEEPWEGEAPAEPISPTRSAGESRRAGGVSPLSSAGVPQADRSGTGAGAAVPPNGLAPTEYWTWRLLERGFTCEEAAEIRGLEVRAIVRHALLSARAGRSVPLEAFFTPEMLRSAERWSSLHGDDPPPPESGFSGTLWELFVACRAEAPRE